MPTTILRVFARRTFTQRHLSTMSTDTTIKVAVLDDYANIAPPYFNKAKGNVAVDYFSKTLNPKIESDLKELVSRLQPYHVICTMRERTPFHKELLSQLPNLKLLLSTGTRNKGLDLDTCKELGIPVAGTSGKPNAVAGHSDTNEQNWTLILGLAKNTAEDDLRVKTQPEGWQGDLVFGLAGRTLGLLGLGRLGMQCAATGILGFGMKAIAWSTNLTQAKADEAAREKGLSAGSVKVVSSKEELLSSADVVSVHYVLSDRSRGLMGKKELALMKKNSLLINTSRGPLIDESALLETLREGRIRGAALDVFETEPLPSDSPWRSQEWGKNGRSHVLLSPHSGYIEEVTMNWMYQQNVENLERWLNGEELETRLA